MEFIGNNDIKSRIKIAKLSAIARNQSIPHIMLAGTAGCGKTTTARWLSKTGDYNYFPATPSSLKTKKDVYTLLEKLNHTGYNKNGDRVGKIKPTILFFDEIHQLNTISQEILGLAMERFILESNKPNKYIWLPYFTMVGATTDDGKLTKPFRERFKLKFIYSPYEEDEMYEIVKFHANKQNLIIVHNAIKNITKRSRGIPRIMVTYLENIRDVALVNKVEIITNELVNEVFDSIGIDKTGLTLLEIKILKLLYIAKGTVGLDNISIATNESIKTISQSIEPFLIRRGLIIRMSKGRIITDKGIKYLEESGHLGNSINNKMYIDADYRRQ